MIPLLEFDGFALLVVILRVSTGLIPAVCGAEQHSGLLRLCHAHSLVCGGGPFTGGHALCTGTSGTPEHFSLGYDNDLVSGGGNAEALIRQEERRGITLLPVRSACSANSWWR